MAVDSKQKRASAISPSSPWRGPLVDPAESGFTQGNRQAAAFMYSGILAGGAVEPSGSILPQMLQMGLYANG